MKSYLLNVNNKDVKSSADPGGVSEVGVATLGPALCNALAAVGYRPRIQPIKKEGFTWVRNQWQKKSLW